MVKILALALALVFFLPILGAAESQRITQFGPNGEMTIGNIRPDGTGGAQIFLQDSHGTITSGRVDSRGNISTYQIPGSLNQPQDVSPPSYPQKRGVEIIDPD